MILTMPIFITCMIFASISLVAMIACIVARLWARAVAGYLGVGLWLIAVPFKIGLHATSCAAMIYLSVIWPLWVLRSYIHFNLFPAWLMPLMFNL